MALALSVCAGSASALGDAATGVTKTCKTSCEGSSYPGTLKGTHAANHIESLGDNESATFNDLIQGFGGKDALYGDAGGDRIEGGSGNDTIFGGLSEYVLIDGTGEDHMNGSSSRDIIRAKDGYKAW
jgi:Ca2+-binding RTX toxin-like protein